jgi:hypothetical protein
MLLFMIISMNIRPETVAMTQSALLRIRTSETESDIRHIYIHFALLSLQI